MKTKILYPTLIGALLAFSPFVCAQDFKIKNNTGVKVDVKVNGQVYTLTPYGDELVLKERPDFIEAASKCDGSCKGYDSKWCSMQKYTINKDKDLNYMYIKKHPSDSYECAFYFFYSRYGYGD